MSRQLVHSLTGAGLALLLGGGCTSPQVGSPCPIRENVSAEERAKDIANCFNAFSDTPFNTSLQKDVDILFVIDNSPSMSPKQRALAVNIPRFIEKIDMTGANYHVGVVTSDVGTFVAPGQPWSISLGTCNTFEGDDGTLQRVACTTRTGSGLSDVAKSACQELCPDPKYVPTQGKGYIAKVNGQTNIPEDKVQEAFKCIALVGDNGCGIEGPLEGAKRALDGHNMMNTDFLRPNSVLAVIFITDEDDCSVQLARRNENDPNTMDCSSPDKNASFSCFNPDFRCLARDVECSEPLNTAGPKTNCKERDNSYLEPIANYVKFFSALRPSSRLLISGIWTIPSLDKREAKFEVRQANMGTKSDGLNRASLTDAGCYNAANPACLNGDVQKCEFGRPQIRLSKFASQFRDSLEVSVCNVDAYPQALDSIANAIKTKLEANCLPQKPKLSNGQPVCVVGDVDARSPNDSPPPNLAFPTCSKTCCDAWAKAATPTFEDMAIQQACGGESAQACYCAVESTAGACMGGVVAGVVRKGMPPTDKVTNFKCASQ